MQAGVPQSPFSVLLKETMPQPPEDLQLLTACLVDLPPAFSSFSFFSCFSYCFSSSFCFCWYIFLKVTGAEVG